jgi:hypothetical protein
MEVPEKMKKLNNYFFGEDNISLGDAIWFYGFTIFSILIAISTFGVVN